MLSTIVVRNAAGNILNLSLEDASSGFVVNDVDGLDPVKAAIVSSPFANMDGEQYHSSRRDLRNIVIKLDLVPDYISTSVQDLRNQLYKFFMPKTTVNLTFQMSDGKSYIIAGRIETCESTLFAKDPQMAISLMCFDPDFQDLTPTVISGGSTNTINTSPVNFEYQGSVETGVTITLNVNRTINDITFYHTLPDGSYLYTPISYPMLSGDVVTITTDPGRKGVTLKRNNVVTSILYATPPSTYWTELQPGTNGVKFVINGTIVIPYTVSYTARYGGL
jgi:hypothetical protein